MMAGRNQKETCFANAVITFCVVVVVVRVRRKTGRDGNPQFSANTETAHQFQEYTYKKITPCDFCSQVLRGKSRFIISHVCFIIFHEVVIRRLSELLFADAARPGEDGAKSETPTDPNAPI